MAFNSLITNAGRLQILTALAAEAEGGRPFVELRRRTGLTDGNLATHARRLQSAGYIAIEKSITAGKPLTTLHITREGRDALASHVAALQSALTPKEDAIVAATIDADDWVD